MVLQMTLDIVATTIFYIVAGTIFVHVMDEDKDRPWSLGKRILFVFFWPIPIVGFFVLVLLIPIAFVAMAIEHVCKEHSR